VTRRDQLHDAADLRAALEGGQPVQLVLHRESGLSPGATAALALARDRGVELRPLSQNQLTRLCQARREPELLALIGDDPKRNLEDALASAHTVWLLVDTAYPGNAGFVIRTAEVSGADAVVVGAPFDHEQRRAVRRTAMRADRYMPVLYHGAADTIERGRACGLEVIGIEDSGERAPWEHDLTGRALLVLGGERHGIPPELLERCDQVLRLPMEGFVPSYNLQAAMAMVVGERWRQRVAGPPRPPEAGSD
jgi:TrmH family RNA methyltransferase